MSIVIPAIATSTVTNAQVVAAVANAPKFAWNTYQVRASITPVQNAIVDIVVATGGVQIVSLSVFHHNDETDGKEIDCLLNHEGTAYLYDASVIGGMGENEHNAFVLTCSSTAEIAWVLDQVGFQAGTSTLPWFTKLSAFTTDLTHTGEPLFGHQITLQIRMTSALGTNPTMAYKCTYKLLELV